ncbi:hypothetical protein RJ639_040136 [Escallonia herrerae]|uniref:Uncharacterized protein n=1 Tax=Escallonia herrerae TaxID=1293975 RepID=A0AA88WZ81_9ASTE|nr:hypothetical protein RJ639_040136 [Escallonia herrerae]
MASDIPDKVAEEILEGRILETCHSSGRVKQAVIGSHGLDTQFSGVNFLESLVSEFSPSTSTAMGLPREFHEQCRTSLELDYLKAFYCWAQDAALRVTNRIIGSNSAVPKVRVCSAALRLMLQILNWDFRYNTNAEGAKKSIDVFSTGVGQDSNSPKRSDYSLVQVPQAIQNHMMESRETEHPVVVLSSLVIKFAEQSLDPEMRASFFGPRLMEGKAMLDIIVRISTTTLVSYPGEKDLQELACHQLFHGLVRRRNPPRPFHWGDKGSPVTMKLVALITAAAAALPPPSRCRFPLFCCRTMASLVSSMDTG